MKHAARRLRIACATSALCAACAGEVDSPRGLHHPHDASFAHADGGAARDAALSYASPPPRASTRVMTWNIEWFGDAAHDPEDVAQTEGVVALLHEWPTDVLALQEIADERAHDALLARFTDYEGVLGRGPASQRMALWARRSRFAIVDVAQIGGLDDAGRPPLAVCLRARTDGMLLRVVVVHAKAGLDAASAARRRAFADGLAEALAASADGLGTIVLGDFNDEIERSLVDGGPSPYAPWLARGWQAPTRLLERPGRERSTAWGAQLDHVILDDALAPSLWPASVDVLRDELSAHAPDFSERVSDHFPVRLRMSAPGETR